MILCYRMSQPHGLICVPQRNMTQCHWSVQLARTEFSLWTVNVSAIGVSLQLGAERELCGKTQVFMRHCRLCTMLSNGISGVSAFGGPDVRYSQSIFRDRDSMDGGRSVAVPRPKEFVTSFHNSQVAKQLLFFLYASIHTT
jgi:hypothetical protein